MAPMNSSRKEYEQIIVENLESIKNRIQRFIKNFDQRVTIVAVSKKMVPWKINTALTAGQHVFGESYIQEAANKIPSLPKEIEWHMVGHLQRNKAKKAVMMFNMIQSIDSIRLATEIERRCKNLGKKIRGLIQVNISGVKNQFGVQLHEIPQILQELSDLRFLQIEGLMAIGPMTTTVKVRKTYSALFNEFQRLQKLEFGEIKLKTLSLGMSNDFEVAVSEGSTMVRIGTAIFGRRSM